MPAPDTGEGEQRSTVIAFRCSRDLTSSTGMQYFSAAMSAVFSRR